MEITGQLLTKNDRLIGEFMGYEVITYKGKLTYNGNKYAKTIGELRTLWNGLYLEYTGRSVEEVVYPFNSDLNYLIPVIRAIEERGYVVCIAGIRYQVYKLLEENNPIISLVCGDLTKKTEMVYFLVTSFIEEFNKTLNKTTTLNNI